MTKRPICPERRPDLAEVLTPLKFLGRRGGGGEIADLLKVLESRGIETVHELTGLVSKDRIALVRRVYEAEAGRQPRSFEVVANPVNAAGAETGPEMADRIRTQMELLQAWTEVKRARRG